MLSQQWRGWRAAAILFFCSTLLYTGSRSMLVTLTIETFKHNQANPSAHKAESLRQAMLTVLINSKTAHPTFWAPYALVGDGAR